MSRYLNSILCRAVLFGCATALAARAQDIMPAPEQPATWPGFDSQSPNPWRIERIDPDYDTTRHFRLGMAYALNIKGDFKMSSSSTFGISDNSRGIFSDGYVQQDSTGDAGNLTSNWGYQNSSQYDSGANTITMHGATQFGIASDASSHGNNSPNVGIDLAYGDSFWYWAHAKIGYEFGLGALPIHVAGQANESGTVSTVAFTFQLPSGPGGPVIPPDAPYSGDNSGVGPLLGDTPISSTPSGSSGATINSTESLDVWLLTARLGPTLYWDMGQYLGLYVGAGPAVGLAHGNLGFDDAITFGSTPTTVHNRGAVWDTAVTYGGYANATLVYHAVENGDFYAGFQYMSLRNMTIAGGGREGRLNLGGQLMITFGINWPF